LSGTKKNVFRVREAELSETAKMLGKKNGGRGGRVHAPKPARYREGVGKLLLKTKGGSRPGPLGEGDGEE